MLPDVRTLLTICPPSAMLGDYQAAVVDDNVLLKATVVTRKTVFSKLRQLYALDPQVLLFRALRDLWGEDPEAQPLLALLSAVARDPILRCTSPAILEAKLGERVTSAMLAAAADTGLPGRYNKRTLASIGRNTASSWQQSGHLVGRLVKTRSMAKCRPTSVAFALLLGYLCGARGEALFSTLWSRLLDAPAHILQEQATVASRHGYLEYRQAGGIVDVGFRFLLRDERRIDDVERG